MRKAISIQGCVGTACLAIAHTDNDTHACIVSCRESLDIVVWSLIDPSHTAIIEDLLG